ncbi:hydrogenase accessory protein HypB [Nitrosomonas sp. JL21]|uniref:hydrogenase nickel incorporation protein HypB n=1 Tax=Nitrosomonas sp. JL21 TaxID=153949 RepID=UPI00136BE6A6|nr:hydrogenase nickel incorporation protein HypB [Nitrosomonas sp. JL21]MBL8497866.1 hydrogenase nickel incorporation protein HypB [Nitrosomonas sp.]MCC7091378.1 hydrogenase nickel incorporation protein HypB [Nitrosomonas sp.]MXS76813.1 hydrogenase accessory protein HypB [Nitrosomonas sp. JL21]
MCTTCGCGLSQIRINNKPMRIQRQSHQSLTYRPLRPSPAQNHEPIKDPASNPLKAKNPGRRDHQTSETRMIKIERDILAENNRYATQNRHYFSAHRIFALNLLSSPGSGKTTLLVQTIQMLRNLYPIAVIEGDQQTDHDATRIRATGAPAVQINTGKGCHLDAAMIDRALQQMHIENNSVLFIENVGNLVCPASFDLGEAHKVIILSVTEGEDKPLKYPDMFQAADLLLLNKCDLLPHLTFDTGLAIEYAHRINPSLPVIQISATHGSGMTAWLEWIEACRRATAGALRQ